jgi:sugar phosphate isomerase/epimerase
MQWFGRPHPPADIALSADWKRLRLAAVFGHTGYLINLGAPPSGNRDKSLQSLIQEITFAGALGLPFLVLHPGAHLGAGEDGGLARRSWPVWTKYCARPKTRPCASPWKTRRGRGAASEIKSSTWRPFTTA